MDDELFKDAVEAVIMQGNASCSLLQRKLKISYMRAAKLMDAMEEAGVVGPSDGAKPRIIMPH